MQLNRSFESDQTMLLADYIFSRLQVIFTVKTNNTRTHFIFVCYIYNVDSYSFDQYPIGMFHFHEAFNLLGLRACAVWAVINSPLLLHHRNYSNEISIFIRWDLVCSINMDRPDKRKPLTPELKGSLITLYNCGYSFSQIANKIGCHVSIGIIW